MHACSLFKFSSQSGQNTLGVLTKVKFVGSINHFRRNLSFFIFSVEVPPLADVSYRLLASVKVIDLFISVPDTVAKKLDCLILTSFSE